MSEEAATSTGGAEVSARPDASADRLMFSHQMSERILKAIGLEIREVRPLPTHCKKCGKKIHLDSRSSEMCHDGVGNRDHRPVTD